MASPSRTTTRSTPRTSRALAGIPIRRAAPTSASAASGPGQVISSEDERPGSVSDPCARNAPRQAASASQVDPDTTCGGSPRTGRPAAVEQPGLPGQRLAVLDHAHDVAVAPAQPTGGEDGDLAGLAEDLGDLAAQPAGRRTGVELGLDDDAAADDVQATGETQHRGHLGLAAARLGDRQAGQLVLDRRRHRHGGDPATAHQGGERSGQPVGVVPGRAVGRGDRGEDQLGAEDAATDAQHVPGRRPRRRRRGRRRA